MFASAIIARKEDDMRLLRKEILFPLTAVTLFLSTCQSEMPSASQAALRVLNADANIARAQGTIPDPDATPTPSVTATPEPTPEPTYTGPYRYDLITAHTFAENGAALQGVPYEITIGSQVITGTTDEVGQAQAVSYDPTVDEVSVEIFGPNNANSASAEFESTNPDYETATMSTVGDGLTAKLEVDFSAGAEAASGESAITKITGEADITDSELSIQTSTGINASLADFETQGSLTINREGSVSTASEGSTTANDAEITIFSQEEDADGFAIEIDTGNGTTSRTNIPAGMFKGGRLSIRTADIDEAAKQVTVTVDEDDNPETENTTAVVETEIVTDDEEIGEKVFLPHVTR